MKDKENWSSAGISLNSCLNGREMMKYLLLKHHTSIKDVDRVNAKTNSFLSDVYCCRATYRTVGFGPSCMCSDIIKGWKEGGCRDPTFPHLPLTGKLVQRVPSCPEKPPGAERQQYLQTH